MFQIRRPSAIISASDSDRSSPSRRNLCQFFSFLAPAQARPDRTDKLPPRGKAQPPAAAQNTHTTRRHNRRIADESSHHSRAVFLLLPSSSRLVSSGPSLSVSRLSRPIKTTSLQTQRTLFSCPTAPFHSVSNPTNIPYTTRSNHEASWTTRMDCRHGGGRICHGMRRYVMLYCA
jgi:hypothetical protein